MKINEDILTNAIQSKLDIANTTIINNSKEINSYSINSDDGYIRFNNGIQFAWVKRTLNIPKNGFTMLNTNAGSSIQVGRRGMNDLYNWPVAFSHFLIQKVFTPGRKQVWIGGGDATTTKTGAFYLYRPYQNDAILDNMSFWILGIGYWK